MKNNPTLYTVNELYKYCGNKYWTLDQKYVIEDYYRSCGYFELREFGNILIHLYRGNSIQDCVDWLNDNLK